MAGFFHRLTSCPGGRVGTVRGQFRQMGLDAKRGTPDLEFLVAKLVDLAADDARVLPAVVAYSVVHYCVPTPPHSRYQVTTVAAIRCGQGVLVRADCVHLDARDYTAESVHQAAKASMGEWTDDFTWTQPFFVNTVMHSHAFDEDSFEAVLGWVLAGEGPEIAAARAELLMAKAMLPDVRQGLAPRGL